MKKRKRKYRLKLKYKNILLLILIIFLIVYPKSYFKKHNVYVKHVNENVSLELSTENTYFDIDGSNYIAVGEEVMLLSNHKKTVWESTNPEVVSVSNGLIKGLSDGDAVIIAKIGKVKKEVDVSVTSLVKLESLDEKPKLKCDTFTKEEADILDDILASRINKVGYKTRAGVLEAARFLSLKFPYTIEYFFENGRLTTNGVRRYVDGEGRYYHKGLYLTKDKFSDLKKSDKGPAAWGCRLYERSRAGYFPNGLDCSGFISWALLNGGYDPGDVGAGVHKQYDNDLDDLGNKTNISKDMLSKVKAGDLIGFNGHIGIIIGIDRENDKYYIAESYYDNHTLHVDTYSSKSLLGSTWKYIMLMDSYYKNDGKLNEILFTNE